MNYNYFAYRTVNLIRYNSFDTQQKVSTEWLFLNKILLQDFFSRSGFLGSYTHLFRKVA